MSEGLEGIRNNAHKANSNRQPAPVPNVAAFHHVQQPAPVVPPNVAAGPSSFGSTAQLQSHNLPLHQVNLMPLSSPVGQDETFEKIRIFLNDDNNGIIGIYGMGGVGKTTLMKSVHNYLSVKCSFDKIIWIVVSKEVDERKIQRDILAKLGLPASQDETQDGQAIYNKLRMMKFVLLLDDIWKPLDIVETLGIPIPSQENKSKIIFTTRSKEVSAQMHPHKEVQVVGLGWENAWILFQKNVGDKALNSNPSIRGLAEQVAKECGGLPLALKVIGRAMAGKCTPQQWNYALTTLRNSPSEISGTEDELFSRLEFSYDALPNQTIKQCFLYCCLFPEDFSIDKKQLVEYWVGEGFLGSDENLIVARNKGLHYINTLVALFLLEECEVDRELASPLEEDQEVQEDDEDQYKRVKMHDVIRDMAIWIATDHGKKKPNFFVHPSVRLTKSQTADRWKEAHRVFVWNSKELPQMTSLCHISTILFWDSDYIFDIGSLDGLFNSTRLLRVLDLPYFNHEDLRLGTISMKKMVELRYLRLGTVSCTRTSLPLLSSWLGNLTKLETLILSGTRIRVLPNTIGQLVELRHLNLANCENLEKLPVELGNCCKLEILNLQSTRIGMLPTTVGKLSDLRHLNLDFCEKLEALPVELGDCCKVEMLNLKNCSSLEMLPTTVGKLSDLRYLNLSETRIKTLPEEFWELNKLEDLYFLGDETMRFTAIELSKLEDMQYLKHVEICVKGLPNLSRLSNCLTSLRVGYCPSAVEICEDELSMDFLQVFGNADKLSHLRIEESPVEKIKASHINTESTTFSSLEILTIEIVVEDKLSLGNLRELEIWTCDRLKHIFGLHHLPRLESLSLEYCEKLEQVIISENSSGGGGNICFPRLTYLEIIGLHGLKGICCDSVSFPSLETIWLEECPRLEKLPLGLMNGLRDLTISECEKLEEVIISENSSGGGNICFPRLTSMCIDGLHGLKSICSDSVSFPSLETFQLEDCPRLEKLPLGLMNGGNSTLRDLTIRGCEKLEEVIISENSSGGGGNICFPTLRELIINRLHGLKSICSDSVSFPSLEEFYLSDCPRLEKLPLGLMNGGNSTLRDLTIRGCEKLEEVIISENSSGGGGNICFPTLRELIINRLHGLKSICSDSVSFPSLEEFYLSDCPRLEKLPLGLMNGGNSTLRDLTIRGCEKLEEVIISENTSGGGGNICFPTLRKLSIEGLHGLKSICSDSVSFPSLETFRLSDCPRLEKLPLGLMNGGNSTLRDLTIRGCEKLEEVIISENTSGGGGNICFPTLRKLSIEGLHGLKSICSDSVSFPSLETFRLSDCPRLEKLPLGLMNGGNSTLRDYTITGSEEWWDGLEWQDDNFKSFLQPFYLRR